MIKNKNNNINEDNASNINEEYQIKNGKNIQSNNDLNNTNIIINNNKNEQYLISGVNEEENIDISFSHLETKEIHYPKGIKNLGLSCYMNSLLQCLFNIK